MEENAKAEVRLIRLESNDENLSKNLIKISEEMKEFKIEMNNHRDNRMQINHRIEILEEKSKDRDKKWEQIDEALKGNVTTKMLRQWIIGAAGIVTALMVLGNILIKIFK